MLSTPFDETAADLLADLQAPAYKIASFEVIDLPLVAHVARKGKPMVISTGMASLGEIGDAVRTARENGCDRDRALALHQLVSGDVRAIPTCAPFRIWAKPSAASQVCQTIRRAPSLPLRLLLLAAASSRSTSPWHARTEGRMLPSAWSRMNSLPWSPIAGTRGRRWDEVSYDRPKSESGSMLLRRSLYAVADVSAGDELTHKNVRSIRPGFGLPPKHLPHIVGRKARVEIRRGTPLSWDLVV